MTASLRTLLDDYQLSSGTIELVRSTPIVLLVGVAGAGKDTIKHRLLETGDYHHIVSHTTRPPRENNGVMEQDGREYHFIDSATAERMVAAGEFVEAKFVHGSTVYGTSAAEIQRAQSGGRIAITDIDVQGVAEYKAISANVIAIFVLPPSFTAWQERLMKRYGQNVATAAGDIAKRKRTAISELEEALSKPYYHFVINDNLDAAVTTVNKIAHNHDTFNAVDDSVRQQASALLQELRRQVAA